ncbi:peptide chain release factor N(5)-glutamine methyltransferase [Patescibacteria group bacterium]|nr:MAG: peptide chain release factor N(5)-glutamine methyltransferase [Patescibacteria group bacterium]
MLIREALFAGTKKLSRHREEWSSNALDAELLLAFALKKPREFLYSHNERPLPPAAAKRYRAYLARRLRHEPVAYILGAKEFFGLKIEVKKRCTLIPRPETEILVEKALELLKSPNTKFQIPNSKYQIIDVGTGSGAIAVAVAQNMPQVRVIATDNSACALRVARQNARLHGVASLVKFTKADILQPTLSPIPYSLSTIHYPLSPSPLILANLPYVPTREWQKLPPEIRRYEPRAALDGGRDGLTLYRRLLAQINQRSIKSFTLLAEIHPEQKTAFRRLIKKYWPKAQIAFHQDLAGKIRVVETMV